MRSECVRLCSVPVLHGTLQRMLGISHPGIAHRKDSQPEIECHAKPEPRGVTITLHTTDAPNHYAGPNAVNTEPISSNPTPATKILLGTIGRLA
jgi:hypothetical protein